MNRDLSKFEPSKAEPDGHTKELFGMPCKTGETEAHPINENIVKGFEEFTKMMFRQGQADIELVIKIDENEYNNLIKRAHENIHALSHVDKMILYGTPLQKGHWLSQREHCRRYNLIPSGLGSYFWCSECNHAVDVREWHRNHYNYCPTCGARMVEPQESEEEELPPVTPQPRWITLSEKWPEDCQEVFVTTDEGNIVTDVFHVDSGGYYFEDRDVEYVTAWMPLFIKPYRESEVEDEKDN